MNTHTAQDMLDSNDHDVLLGALMWQVDMGVTWAVDDTSIDRFAEFEQQLKQLTQSNPNPSTHTQQQGQKPPPQSQNQQTLGAFEAVQHATQMAENASDLSTLHRTIENFDGCGYKSTASRTVTHFGTTTPKLLIVMGAPDRVLDTGGDFYTSGRGLMIKRMLHAIGVNTDDVCITHSVFWRPPGDSAPQDKNIKICQPLLLKQIALLNPDYVLCFGNTPLKSLLANPQPIARCRGIWQTGLWQNNDGQQATETLMPTIAPHMLAKDPSRKRLVWQDLLALQAKIKGAKP